MPETFALVKAQKRLAEGHLQSFDSLGKRYALAPHSLPLNDIAVGGLESHVYAIAV